MKQNVAKQFLLYRYRYILSYGLFLVALCTLLFLEITNVPAGLTQAEKQSAVTSMNMQFNTDMNMVDAPYHWLQKGTIWLLGLTAFAIKLPSIIFGILSGIGLLLLLRRWFKSNVAIISALISVTSTIFLISGRTGTALIMVIFWATYLLLLATLITQQAKGLYGWKILFGGMLALSLYTPLSLYIIGAAFIAGLLHPHARYVLKRYGGPEMVGALFMFIIFITPLAYGLWLSPSIALELLGVPQNLPSAGEYGQNLWSLLVYFGGFTVPRIAETIQPAFTVAVLVLIALGFLRTLRDHHATRTYALLIWSAVIIPVVAFQPQYVLVIFIPAVLFMAIGVQTLIREWYSLFPRNPYARAAGLLPLITLIVGVSYYNYTTYFIGYRYSPAASQVFNSDLQLLNNSLASIGAEQKVTAIVDMNDLEFYKIAEQTRPIKQSDSLRVISSNESVPSTHNATIFAQSSGRSRDKLDSMPQPTTFLVNDLQDNSLRWYVYKR